MVGCLFLERGGGVGGLHNLVDTSHCSFSGWKDTQASYSDDIAGPVNWSNLFNSRGTYLLALDLLDMSLST